MAAENGRTNHTVAARLAAEPYRFEFFQAVRLLELIAPERSVVGRQGLPRDEVVRFRARNSLDFPPSEIHELTSNGRHAGPLWEMLVAFMGLTGPQGVLPHVYTEQVLECAESFRKERRHRARPNDAEADEAARVHPLVDFLDIFNHRLISLFYRAWEKYRLPLAYERSADDVCTPRLLSLLGFGTEGLRGRLSLPDESLLAYGGLLAQRPHSASALAALLADFFSVPVRIEQFVPAQVRLAADQWTRLGRANHRLGVNAVAGTRVWLQQAKFRVVLGPLTFNEFSAFLPVSRHAKTVRLLRHYPHRPPRLGGWHKLIRQGGAPPSFAQLTFGHIFDWLPAALGTAYQPAVELTRLMVGAECDFELQPILKAAEVPTTTLLQRGRRQPMLGWTTWLHTKPATADAAQVRLSAARRNQV